MLNPKHILFWEHPSFWHAYISSPQQPESRVMVSVQGCKSA